MDFTPVFQELRSILFEYEGRLVVTTDQEDHFYLDTSFIMKNKKPMFFGMVQIKKNFVSFHLMAVYVYPELLDGMSETLKKRMQGKSCFNFKKVDPTLFEEVRALTKACFEKFQEEGYITE